MKIFIYLYVFLVLLSSFVLGLQRWNYQMAGLKSHNYYRAVHGSPPLRLDSALCAEAQKKAESLARQRVIWHMPGRGYGENLYGGTHRRDLSKTVQEAVRRWYKEIELYNYKSPGFSSGTGHFTALVWKSTNALGIGAATINGYTVVVACYKPAGNIPYKKYFWENVRPPMKLQYYG